MNRFVFCVLLCVTAVLHGQTVTPSKVVMGLGDLVTISGDYPSNAIVDMDGTQCTVTAHSPGSSITVRVRNRQFWYGPKRLTITDPADLTVIDDEDVGYAKVGTWTSTTWATSWNADQDFSAGGTGTDTATWTFTGLTPGTYEVWTTWNAFSNHATDAPYTILDNATPLATVDVDQLNGPNGRLEAGVVWQSLGSYAISSTTLAVQLTDNANGTVVADAVALNLASIDADQTVIDGKLQVTKLRPYGTEIVMWDFEDNETPTGNYWHGNSIAHQWNANYNTGGNSIRGLANEPSHGSNYSFYFRLFFDTVRQYYQQYMWITNSQMDSYVNEDGITFSGVATYIPEATGMNRNIYDLKLPSGYAEDDTNMGSYNTIENDGVMPADETYNWHFYSFMRYNADGSWEKIYNPLCYTAQRSQFSGQGIFGPGAARPFNYGMASHYAGNTMRWTRGQALANAPFDNLTRVYNQYKDQGVFTWGESGTLFWLDNIGFACVDEQMRPSSAEWMFKEAAVSTSTSFPFHVTNTADYARDFYVFACFFSTKGTGWATMPAGTALYRDVNANGSYDVGTDTAIAASGYQPVLLGAIDPGETQHFVVTIVTDTTTNEYREVVVNFIENVTTQTSNKARVTPDGSPFEPGPPNMNMTPTTAYLTWNFIAYAPATLIADEVDIPTNPTALHIGDDTWIQWDDSPQAVSGALSYYEVQRSDDGATGWAHYYVSSAASPGFIDYGVQGKFYRVAEVNVRGTQSDWSAVAGAATSNAGTRVRTRRGIRFGRR